MLKKKIIKVAAAVTLGLVLNSTTFVNATKYDGPLNAESPVSAKITSPKEIVVPPINPENPILPPAEPTNSENENGLSLVYVSGLNFPKVEFDFKQSQTVEANSDSGIDSDGKTIEFDNMVTVMDIRDQRSDGWDLRVSQVEELFNGAVISMNPEVYSNDMGVSVPTVLDVNESPKLFASADGFGEAGIISLGMGEVKLSVPAKTGVGDFSTTLKWELISEPQPEAKSSYKFTFKGYSDIEFASMNISLRQMQAVINTIAVKPHYNFETYAYIIIKNKDGAEKYNKQYIGNEVQSKSKDTVDLATGDFIIIHHKEFENRFQIENIKTGESLQKQETNTFQVTEEGLVNLN